MSGEYAAAECLDEPFCNKHKIIRTQCILKVSYFDFICVHTAMTLDKLGRRSERNIN